MLKPIARILSLKALLLFSSLASAAVADSAIDQLLHLSGFEAQTAEIPAVMKSGFEDARQQGAELPEEMYRAFVVAMDKSLRPSEIRKIVVSSLKGDLTEAEVNRLLTWYQSDLGRKITAEELAVSTPDGYRAMLQSADKLMADSKRMAFAQEVDRLTGATDFAVTLQETVSVAVFSAMMKSMDPQAILDIEQVQASLKSELAQTRSAIEQSIALSIAYTYRNVPMEELEQYRAFLAEGGSVKFTTAAMRGFKQALDASINEFIDSMAAVLAQGH